MAKTILITGASSGIGRVTARCFLANGWNVIATMRSPEKETEFADGDNLLVTRLDVVDRPSIASAVAAGIERFGQIDVLLNNAGYGAYGPLEASSMERIERQFETNVIGLLAVTKEVLPHFRARKSGMIVNVSSVAGQLAFPLGALYHGTKFAVEGISESLQYELASLGVQVKVVQPGLIATDFGGRSFDFAADPAMPEYQPVIEKLLAGFGGSTASEPEVVADVIWAAVNDGTDRLRYRAGPDAQAILDLRKASDDESFFAGMKSRFGL